jgi:hypothetical protein
MATESGGRDHSALTFDRQLKGEEHFRLIGA